jgi:four helix bundle protein
LVLRVHDLKVWNAAVELTVQVYGLTGAFPKTEVYGLSSQMRRAAVSVASNIAEGSARGTRKDFRQFVALAQGSNFELQTQLLISRRLGFGNAESFGAVDALSVEVGKMLTALRQYLERDIRPADQQPSQTTNN